MRFITDFNEKPKVKGLFLSPPIGHMGESD